MISTRILKNYYDFTGIPYQDSYDLYQDVANIYEDFAFDLDLIWISIRFDFDFDLISFGF